MGNPKNQRCRPIAATRHAHLFLHLTPEPVIAILSPCIRSSIKNLEQPLSLACLWPYPLELMTGPIAVDQTTTAPLPKQAWLLNGPRTDRLDYGKPPWEQVFRPLPSAVGMSTQWVIMRRTSTPSSAWMPTPAKSFGNILIPVRSP